MRSTEKTLGIEMSSFLAAALSHRAYQREAKEILAAKNGERGARKNSRWERFLGKSSEIKDSSLAFSYYLML